MRFFVSRRDVARSTTALAAIVALAFGVIMYVSARSGAVNATAALGLAPFPWFSLGWPDSMTGSLPTFVHAFAFSALAALAVTSMRAVVVVVLAWFALEAAYEIGQLTGWINGTFDAVDIAAACAGCMLAAFTARPAR